jgi:hypothetical protein
MTYTPFQWRNFHDRVLDLWRVFVASYGADTGAHTIGGGKWICADSGTAKEATEAERLRTLAAAHAAGAMTGNGNTRDSVIKLRAMGCGGSLPTDTGAS